MFGFLAATEPVLVAPDLVERLRFCRVAERVERTWKPSICRCGPRSGLPGRESPFIAAYSFMALRLFLPSRCPL